MKTCKICSIPIIRNKKYSQKQWDDKIFCSLRCCGVSKRGSGHTKETRKKLSIAHLGTKKPWAGKYKHSEKHNINIGESLKNFYILHPEERKKISIRMTGRKMGDEFVEKMKRIAKRGKDNPSWKGINASYSSKHKVVYRSKKRTGICIDCGVVGKTEWSNVDGKYTRELNDYQERCRKCHHKYDKVSEKRRKTILERYGTLNTRVVHEKQKKKL